jgi:hypothetical protein
VKEERERILKTILFELNKFLQVYESRRKMQVESKKRWIFPIDGFSNRTSYKITRMKKKKH